jgi:hypothetical protein
VAEADTAQTRASMCGAGLGERELREVRYSSQERERERYSTQANRESERGRYSTQANREREREIYGTQANRERERYLRYGTHINANTECTVHENS